MACYSRVFQFAERTPKEGQFAALSANWQTGGKLVQKIIANPLQRQSLPVCHPRFGVTGELSMQSQFATSPTLRRSGSGELARSGHPECI